jgi:GGDEF domain-containing protein
MSENKNITIIPSSFDNINITKDINTHVKHHAGKTSSENISQEFLDMSSVMFMMVENGIISYANPACVKKLKHFSKASIVGRKFSDLIFAASNTEANVTANNLLHDHTPTETNLMGADNRALNIVVSTQKIDISGKEAYLIEAVDITKAVLAEKQKAISSCYDLQSGLPNVFLLEDRLEMFIARSMRSAHGKLENIQNRVCTISMELDSADFYDEETLNYIIENTGIRLVSGIRQMDTVARTDTTQLSMVVGDINHIDAAEIIARRVMGLIYEPMSYNGTQLDASYSIGIAVFPDNGTKSKILQNNATKAKEAAQEQGGSRYVLYDDIQPTAENYINKNIKEIYDIGHGTEKAPDDDTNDLPETTEIEPTENTVEKEKKVTKPKKKKTAKKSTTKKTATKKSTKSKSSATKAKSTKKTKKKSETKKE